MKTSDQCLLHKSKTLLRRIACFLAVLFATALIGCKNETTIPSATAALTAYPTAAPSESLHWDMEDGWRQQMIDGETVLEGTGHTWATLRDGEWSNCTIHLFFQIKTGTVHMNFLRNTGEDGQKRYFVGVNHTTVYLGKQVGDNFSDLATAAVELDDGWHEMQIKVSNGLINVSVDQTLIFAFQDEDYLVSGGVAFETLDDSDVLLRSIEITSVETIEMVAPSVEETTLRKEQQARASFNPDETHEGDLILNGSEELIIENEQYLQLGNVYLNDNSKLIIRDATFMLGRGDVPTVHVYINVSENAALEIARSTVIGKAEEGAGMLIVIRNHGMTSITDSPTEIHLLEQYDGTVEIQNTEMINEIGGLLQVSGGSTHVVNSTLGALALTVPADASLTLNGLKSGEYLESWDVHDWIPKAGYDLTLENTTILKDNLGPGPYERGWLFFPDANSHISLSDSELRKVFIDINGETVSFENLKIDTPSNLKYRDIELNDVTITGQWPFTIENSNVTIKDSNYLFLQPSGTSNLTLINSHVVEFIPREFYGTVSFENCTWTNAGEIIGGEDYHSSSNDFTIKGSLTISPELRQNLQWKDARVTREFTVQIFNQSGSPVPGLTLSIDGQSYTTDENGNVVFGLIFDETNYNQPTQLIISKQNQALYQEDIDFFTATPIQITVQE